MKHLKRSVAVLVLLVMIVSIVGLTAHAVEPRTTFICPACGGGAYGHEKARQSVDEYVSDCPESSTRHQHRRTITTYDYICDDCGTYVRTETGWAALEYCYKTGKWVYR